LTLTEKECSPEFVLMIELKPFLKEPLFLISLSNYISTIASVVAPAPSQSTQLSGICSSLSGGTTLVQQFRTKYPNCLQMLQHYPHCS
jgi:hypothetical protein